MILPTAVPLRVCAIAAAVAAAWLPMFLSVSACSTTPPLAVPGFPPPPVSISTPLGELECLPSQARSSATTDCAEAGAPRR